MKILILSTWVYFGATLKIGTKKKKAEKKNMSQNEAKVRSCEIMSLEIACKYVHKNDLLCLTDK